MTTAPATNPAAQIATGIRTDDKQTPFEKITHYNNFYEFSTDKEGGRRRRPRNFLDRRMEGQVAGLVAKPKCSTSTTCSRRPPGGARLSHALRRGVVDGGALGRFLVAAARRV